MPDDSSFIQEREAENLQPAGSYCLNIGLKPVRTRKELRALLSHLGVIHDHLAVLARPNVKITQTAVVNISSKLMRLDLFEGLESAGFSSEEIVFNVVPDDDIPAV